jgi:amino acid transporter
MFVFVLLLINLVQMQFQYTSRIILAWVNDELMPASLGFIQPNLKSPVIAVLLVAVIALFSLLVSALTGAVNNPIEYMFLLAVFQLPSLLAVTVLPFVRPAWFEAAPRIARIKLGPIPLISLSGLISFIFVLAVTALPFIVQIEKRISLTAVILFLPQAPTQPFDRDRRAFQEFIGRVGALAASPIHSEHHATLRGEFLPCNDEDSLHSQDHATPIPGELQFPDPVPSDSLIIGLWCCGNNRSCMALC